MGIMNVQANQSDGRESVMCTGVRFSDDEGNTYFGRNLDWSFSYGETILVTPRGYHYDTVFGAGGKAKPNAVIGVGVVMADRPMYFDCANEHGLAIAGLNFPGYASFVHEPVEGTENVAWNILSTEESTADFDLQNGLKHTLATLEILKHMI